MIRRSIDPGELDDEKVETEKRPRCQRESFSVDLTVRKTCHGFWPAFQVGRGCPRLRPLSSVTLRCSPVLCCQQCPKSCMHHLVLKLFRIFLLHTRDEFELEFSGSSRAKLGHFNFRAETELTILTICMSKNSKFWALVKNYYQISQFCFCTMILINFMIIYLNLCSTKGVFIVKLYDLDT